MQFYLYQYALVLVVLLVIYCICQHVDKITNMNKLLLILSCVVAVIADMMLVWFAKKPNHPILFFIGAFLINAFGIAVWTYTMMKGIESATAITFYAVATVAGCSILGYYVFGEHLSNINLAGVILAVVALILMSI